MNNHCPALLVGKVVGSAPIKSSSSLDGGHTKIVNTSNFRLLFNLVAEIILLVIILEQSYSAQRLSNGSRYQVTA